MFKAILGDITKEQVDAIVNACEHKHSGRGPRGRRHPPGRRAELLAKCRMLHGCETGQAKITKGYRLPAKYVIHTPGPIWRGGIMGEEQLLQSCYENCLRLAAENGCRSVTFPSISTGIYRFPLEKASKIAVRTILAFLDTLGYGGADGVL